MLVKFSMYIRFYYWTRVKNGGLISKWLTFKKDSLVVSVNLGLTGELQLVICIYYWQRQDRQMIVCRIIITRGPTSHLWILASLTSSGTVLNDSSPPPVLAQPITLSTHCGFGRPIALLPSVPDDMDRCHRVSCKHPLLFQSRTFSFLSSLYLFVIVHISTL